MSETDLYIDLLPRDDESMMRKALIQAQRAADAGEVPIGAIAVCNGKVIARAYNQVELLKDATAHAEMIVMTQAANALGDWRLEEVTIYVTKEPCAMCAGAMVNSRVKRVVFGLPDPRSGAAGGALDVTGFSGMLHQVETCGGVLLAECRKMIQDFFRTVRKSKSASITAEVGDEQSY